MNFSSQFAFFPPPFKIPEAYFIRDPHTFLLTKDFIKVYMFFSVKKKQNKKPNNSSKTWTACPHRLTFSHITPVTGNENG